MFGAIPRKPGVTAQWFHDHYRHPHGTMGRTISTMRAYTQSHQVHSDLLDARQTHFEATAEVWFDCVQDAIDFPGEPNYVELLIPDEPLFVDMDKLRFVFAEEEVLQSGADWNEEGVETGDRLFRLDRRPISIKLLQYVISEGVTAWDDGEDLALGGSARCAMCGAALRLPCIPKARSASVSANSTGRRRRRWRRASHAIRRPGRHCCAVRRIPSPTSPAPSASCDEGRGRCADPASAQPRKVGARCFSAHARKSIGEPTSAVSAPVSFSAGFVASQV
ncbi:EthD domain-containing protein [Novosphingobium resinovorum]